MISRWLGFVLLGATLVSAPVLADPDIDRILGLDEEPEGVVFEIVEGDEDALQVLLPRVRDAISRIRARFPEIEFALVSHGREEFALQTDNREEYPQVHSQVRSLVEDDVPVHVCATHASWYGVGAEDFPDYVEVAPTGPGQVRLYQQLGYELIVIE